MMFLEKLPYLGEPWITRVEAQDVEYVSQQSLAGGLQF